MESCENVVICVFIDHAMFSVQTIAIDETSRKIKRADEVFFFLSFRKLEQFIFAHLGGW